MNETENKNNTQNAMEKSTEQIETCSNDSEEVVMNVSQGNQKRPCVTETKWALMANKSFDIYEAIARAIALLVFCQGLMR